MISVQEALDIIKENAVKSRTELRLVTESLNYVVAKDLFSPIDMPPFRQSAMDGYAIQLSDTTAFHQLVGESAAGNSTKNLELKTGEAVRVFTGAAVPEGANAVIMQEQVLVSGNQISFTKQPSVGQNIRPQGEQITKAELAYKKGLKITAAAIGYLAGLGITEVLVYKKPIINIVVTGNELVKPGTDLPYGKIYESNSVMLKAVLQSYGYEVNRVEQVKDDYQQTVDLIKASLTSSDVLLLSGGISVGDYDFVGKALAELDVEQLFYKVKQKPGKPLFFGKTKDKLVFALPGNPAAALTCFYMYVLVALDLLSGKQNGGLSNTTTLLKADFEVRGDRDLLLKGVTDFKTTEILGMQSSAMLRSFSEANCIVYLTQNSGLIKAGTEVPTYLF